METAFALLILVLGLSAPFLIVALLKARKARRKLAEQVTTLESQRAQIIREREEFAGQAQVAQDQAADLQRRYRSVMDAEAEAKRISDEATANARRIQTEASDYAERMKASALALNENAKAAATAAKTEAKALLDDAHQESATILDQAKQRAEEIAGDAYRAMIQAEDYQKTIKALKNLIDGYGDQYLVPTYSVLDGLAEEYGFNEAGQALKNARERTKGMVKSGAAAACDYVEKNRRETAIAFVLDAFNGKADTILTRLKKDNVGTLEQEIRDAYHVVNLHGEAFRNARITPEYLAARLDELRAGAVVYALRERDREEQRAIKERIREEERARREFERALKEAQKEEEQIQKALAKAQRMVEKASAEQKAKYEQQIAELQAKLTEAETKEQRALSMAQLTRSGHVYVISNLGSFGDDVLKIGMTRRLEPLDRIKELGDASVPFPFDVHAMLYSEDAPALENELHKRFNAKRMNKVNYRKEFFRVGVKEVRETVTELGIQAAFTLAAEAREYRETQAMDRLSDEEKAVKLDYLLKQEAEDKELVEAE